MPASTRSPSQPVTQASTVYERIRHDLLSGRLAAGRKLQVRFLMETYLAGHTPVREALNRLVSDGLVSCHDQRGFASAPVSATEMDELTRTRCWMEKLALRRAMALRTPEWEEDLVLACHRLLRTPRSASADGYEGHPEWEHLHRAFHRTLLQPCDSRPLRGFCDQLADRLYRYRQLSVTKVYPWRDINAEHQAILQAVLDGDADAAAARLAAHYEATAAIIRTDLGP